MSVWPAGRVEVQTQVISKTGSSGGWARRRGRRPRSGTKHPSCCCLPQVESGAILYIENKGIESYADPKNPPLRTGRLGVRTPTANSRAADLVGKVVRAVRELGPEGSSLKDITAHLHSQGALPADDPQIGNLVRHATKRALQRGFLAQSGKNFTLGTAARHRKSAGRPSVSKKLLGGGPDDDDDDLGVHLHSPSLDGANPHLQVSSRPPTWLVG